MTEWYIGTMGFSYKDWSGPFYPPDLASRDFLSYYSRIFNAAEVDSTFYGTPRTEVVKRWSVITPEGFKFCAKTPRLITHDQALVSVSALMEEFLGVMRSLDEKLGAILIQFPPSFIAFHIDTLEAFLAELPVDLRFAVELRHPSWYTPWERTAEMLSRYGTCWAATQYPGLPWKIYPTASFLYLRWIGQHGSFQHHTHERIDRTKDLQNWWELIRPVADSFEAVFGFTNNDYAGFAPGTANQFKRIAGLPVEEFSPPHQPALF